MKKISSLLFLLLLLLPSNIFAFTDPLASGNNRVCINSLSPDSEIQAISDLVNTNGDWGWTVIVIRKDEMDVSRWQGVLDQMAKKHIIPIIRIATVLDNSGNWQKPADNDATNWADFLSKLYFPIKNKYVQIYNEVNHSSEWGGRADASEYAKELSKTIDALRSKGSDFFVMEAPLDLALNTDSTSLEASVYFATMQYTISGIFKKIDGWASHSYPNPNFAASPFKSGRVGIDGYKWELAQIKPYLDGKNLPVFITETGWARNNNGMDEKAVADNYKIAYQQVWNDSKIVAICPFVLNYSNDNYYQFSFIKKGADLDHQYFESYNVIKNLNKIYGKPERKDDVSSIDSTIPSFVINNVTSKASIKVKNIGNYVWNTTNDLKIHIVADNLTVANGTWTNKEILPGQDAIYTFDMKSSNEGNINININLLDQGYVLATAKEQTESLSYLSFILKAVKKISLGTIFYSSAKLTIL